MKKIIIAILLLLNVVYAEELNETIDIDLKSNKNNNSVKLIWNNLEEKDSFKIYRKTNKGKNYKLIIETDLNEYNDNSLKYGKTYYYKVIVNDNESNVVSEKIVPNKVENLREISVGANNIKISWDKVNVSGYEIYRSTNNKRWVRVARKKSNKLSFNNKRLKSNKTYYYKVRAYKIVKGKKIYGPFSDIIKTKTIKLSKSQKKCINEIKNITKNHNYSKQLLFNKLNYDNKTKETAIKYLKIDFNENAYNNLLIYMKYFDLSEEELIKELNDYELFSNSEIEYSINKYNGDYGDNKSSIELMYKKELYLLGYNEEQVNIIFEKFSINEIKSYLLEKKYNNLIEFKESKYFNINNLDRYQNYFDKNKYSIENSIIYVEIGLDNPFYTNMKKADTSKGTLILVNKYNYIGKKYNANLETLGNGYGSGKLNKEAAKHFREMVDAAKEDGIRLHSVSAYRSYSGQKSLYKSYVKRDGKTKADTYSARPGHSEHNTGLAVDINTASSSAHFENTKEYEWLINNSYKYGFILRYPKDKMFITGYKYEPWHYRYLNVEVATEIHELDVTYEEYLVITKSS